MDSLLFDRSVGDVDLISHPRNGGNDFQFMERSGIEQFAVAQTRQDTQADANQNVDCSRNLGMESILESSHPSCRIVESSKTGQIRYNLGVHDRGDLAISLAWASLGASKLIGDVCWEGGKHCTEIVKNQSWHQETKAHE